MPEQDAAQRRARIEAAVTDLRYVADDLENGKVTLLLEGYDQRGEEVERLETHAAGVIGDRDSAIAERDRLCTENARLRALAEFVVSLDDDDPESAGRVARRSITLTRIVEMARKALAGETGDQDA